MPPKPRFTHIMHTPVEPEMYRFLEERKFDTGAASIAAMVREAINEYLNKEE